ncbi:HlyD family efflux transporter periplasmic adaptor subunit [Chroococcidiopsis sp. CCNUC1]|uniref:HlyD family efflux transporter periplasmic adaptor subunit n=1 Tax=Chroococcidiopsis sp. CCNUC1 TaxID=2653189 RepID=UPI002021AC0D|nr:HlyD family efflux transporter periplasmic adaptor subunit [Chroococcidiopsis sp. CCNUC1]URD49795.1 HlyD family secretion protein [Chroococcidiopsis sp. CCNUC1]
MTSRSNSHFLPLIQENGFLPPLGRWTNVSGLLILAVVWLAVPIASVAKYKVTVKAQAVVRPAGELRLVQAATAGSVMRISVRENQVVKTGDAIATIDDSKLQTKKSQLVSSIGQSRLQLVQINAQISALDSHIEAETDRIDRAVASAQAQLSGRSREYQDKKTIAVADVAEASANVRIAREELQKAQAQLGVTQANFRAAIAGFKAAQAKRNRYESVAKVGALSRDQFEEAQLAVDQQQQAVEAQRAAVQTQEQAIEGLQEAVTAAHAKQQRAQTSLNPSQAEVAIAESRIAQEKASGKGSIATLNKERDALIGQQIEIQKQLERDKSELQQVKFELGQTNITATSDGIISKLNLRNPGQTVISGEEIAQIVPTNAPLVIKAAIAPQEKNKLNEGQDVQMRVSACSYTDYGTLKGRVKAISPDAVVPQGNGASTATSTTTTSQTATALPSFYEVTVEPESLSLVRGDRQCSIQLGMEGRVDIISREETVLQFFLRKARLIADL